MRTGNITLVAISLALFLGSNPQWCTPRLKHNRTWDRERVSNASYITHNPERVLRDPCCSRMCGRETSVVSAITASIGEATTSIWVQVLVANRPSPHLASSKKALCSGLRLKAFAYEEEDAPFCPWRCPFFHQDGRFAPRHYVTQYLRILL